MNVDFQIILQGRGTWGHLRYEFQEVNLSLASERDAREGKSRVEFHLLFREPGTAVWDGRSFSSAAARRDFIDQWFRDQEPRDDVPPPSIEGFYVPLQLHGRLLTNVMFVEGYAQLIFDTKILNVYAEAKLMHDSVWIESGQPGYCDELVTLIGQRVELFEEQFGEFLEIRFSGGSRLIIPWETSAEFASLSVENQFLVWP